MARKLLRHSLFLLATSTLFAQLQQFKPGFNLFSKEQDVQLGKEAAAQVEQQMEVVRNPELQAYIERIGKRLAAQPQAGGFPYTFKVVKDPSINAFALPGGPTFVNTGLIAAADNEDQLAGVMAHEISHVALRHGTNQASKANLIQLPAMLAGAMTGGSMLGQLAQVGVGLGANSVLLKFSRTAESQADLNGAQIMASAGYNPIEMARFFEKLEAQGGHGGPQFLSDHPNPGNRMKAIQDEIRYLPQQNYTASNNDAFRRMQAIVKGLPAGQTRTRASQLNSGGTPNTSDIRPSGQFREYKGRAFSISYPDNWQVFGDNEGAAVTIAPKSAVGRDENGQAQVGYGMMASFYFPQGRNSIDLVQDTNGLIQQLQRSNPGLEVGAQRSRRVRINDQDALVTTMSSQSPYRGETEHDTLATIARPDGLLYLIFIAPARDAQALQGTFDNMVRSLRF
jgi:Zn-dependent protease with chaperone function